MRTRVGKKRNYEHVQCCERWADFKNFFADMGPCPPGHSLDRIDPHGNYEPANCRWATHLEQMNNVRKNHHITIHGRTMTLSQAAREYHIHPSQLRYRIAIAKMSPELAVIP